MSDPLPKQPNQLWKQAKEEFPKDAEARRQRYRELLREAGHLVPRESSGR